MKLGRKLGLLLAGAACLLFTSLSIAATIKLKDGRIVVGEVKKLGNSYSILESNGNRSIVPATDILSIDGQPLGGQADRGTTATGSNAAGATAPRGATGSASFEAARAKANRIEQAILGVQVWEEWIAENPSSPDLPAAKAELKIWNDLYKGRAEKIKGKWVSGDELKQLKARVKSLLDDAFVIVEREGKQYRTVDGTKGVKKLEEVISIYPQSFQANFDMGYYYLRQITRYEGSNELIQKSMQSLERAARYRPDVPAVWSNLAIVYNWRRDYEKSVNAAWTAVQKKDDEQTVSQLGAALYNTPRNFIRSNPRVSQIERDAQSLFQKHGVGDRGGGWLYIRPDYDEIASGEEDPNSPAGLMGNGSGFFVTSDGYLLTNRHVVTDDQQKLQPDVAFRIRMDDGSEKMAEVIAVDDKWDIALLKINVDEPVPFFRIAQTDPPIGSKALVLGYPANGAGFLTLMVGEGQVKNVNKEDIYHVWYDINTTHGNSGGPMIDAEGNIISIISAGRTDEHTSNKFTYVLGLGPDQIRDFLARIGNKAPKVEWNARSKDAPAFDAVTLAEKFRKSTLLVMGIRTTSADVSGKLKQGGEKKGEGKNDQNADGSKKEEDKKDDAEPQP